MELVHCLVLAASECILAFDWRTEHIRMESLSSIDHCEGSPTTWQAIFGLLSPNQSRDTQVLRYQRRLCYTIYHGTNRFFEPEPFQHYGSSHLVQVCTFSLSPSRCRLCLSIMMLLIEPNESRARVHLRCPHFATQCAPLCSA